MDNFEYSIQLNEREWAEFLRAAEECSVAPAALATAEEQSLSDIEQGDSPGRDCPRREGSEPGPGAAPGGRGVPGDTAPQRGRPSGSGDEAEPGSAGGFLCDSDDPAGPAGAAMPSAHRRQPPRPPAATTAGGTAQGGPGQAEEGAAGGGRDTETCGAPGQEAPAASAPVEGSAEKSAAPSEPSGDTSPALGTVPRVAPEGDRAGTEPSSPGGSPSVVRPKVPAQPRKSRRQRGASATEGDRDPAGAGGATGAGKAPPGSPVSPRKGRGKDKAAKGALVRLGSEEAAENKRSVPGPGGDGGEPGAAPPKQRGKEPQSPGKTKAPKHPKAGQAGGLGVRDTVPAVPGDGAAAPPGQGCQEMPGKPPQAGSAAEPGGSTAEGAGGEPAAETPRARSPLCFTEGASAKPNSLDVTWPEMYEYLFCDSQGEEEELGSSPEGRRSPLQREISWPELYEYFFNEPEGSRKKGKAKDRRRRKLGGVGRPGLQKEAPGSAAGEDAVVIPVPEVCERFFPERAHNRTGWRGIFSMAPASEVKKALGALRALLQRQMQLGGGQAPTSQALVPRRSGEELALVPLRGAQVWPEDAETALALRGAAEDPRVLSHKDMCLVFCAFASWAVKTSDLQAPDAWKTMFLASFGTLSAIRYFRRQLREGHPRT
ncbi:PGC-1 and ERR-induced regulator in muscle protein 1 [Prinia subflava]|uniref:PGC-1 and ERR-induced regulator in muscle protein 1 n=1 Tax=Prinia subflava TaxID=208062 RepID=UPI002FE2DEB9